MSQPVLHMDLSWRWYDLFQQEGSAAGELFQLLPSLSRGSCYRDVNARPPWWWVTRWFSPAKTAGGGGMAWEGTLYCSALILFICSAFCAMPLVPELR